MDYISIYFEKRGKSLRFMYMLGLIYLFMILTSIAAVIVTSHNKTNQCQKKAGKNSYPIESMLLFYGWMGIYSIICSFIIGSITYICFIYKQQFLINIRHHRMHAISHFTTIILTQALIGIIMGIISLIYVNACKWTSIYTLPLVIFVSYAIILLLWIHDLCCYMDYTINKNT